MSRKRPDRFLKPVRSVEIVRPDRFLKPVRSVEILDLTGF